MATYYFFVVNGSLCSCLIVIYVGNESQKKKDAMKLDKQHS